MASRQTRAVRGYRDRLKRGGWVRCEVRVRRDDVELIRTVATALRDPDPQAATRALLRDHLGDPRPRGFKELLASCPVDLEFDRSITWPCKVANLEEFKNHLSDYLAAVANGEQVEVRKRNKPLARVVPIRQPVRNRTVLGRGKGSVVVKADLTAPMMPDADWEMPGDDRS